MRVACMSPLARGLITQPSKGTEYGSSHLYAADIARTTITAGSTHGKRDGRSAFILLPTVSKQRNSEVPFLMASAVSWIYPLLLPIT